MNLFERQSRLNQLFTQSPVNAAYLAGTLSGRTAFGHLTDIDIAILLMEQIKSDQFLDYQLYFFSELAKRLESDNIDVVILNQASLLLKLQVIKYGQILFSRDEKQRVSFETKAVMDYLDFKKFDDIQNQALSRRLYGQIGRASCRERVWISVVAVSLKKKKKKVVKRSSKQIKEI